MYIIALFLSYYAQDCNFMSMETYLKRLRKLVLEKMNEGNYTISEFADKCSVSPREISRIKNGEAKNIMLNVFVKICENSDISYIDIFECQEDFERKTEDKAISKFFLTDGNVKYKLSKY